MQKHYTTDYSIQHNFDPNASDEEILQLANLASKKSYMVNKNVINEIYKYASSFQLLETSVITSKFYSN